MSHLYKASNVSNFDFFSPQNNPTLFKLQATTIVCYCCMKNKLIKTDTKPKKRARYLVRNTLNIMVWTHSIRWFEIFFERIERCNGCWYGWAVTFIECYSLEGNSKLSDTLGRKWVWNMRLASCPTLFVEVVQHFLWKLSNTFCGSCQTVTGNCQTETGSCQTT